MPNLGYLVPELLLLIGRGHGKLGYAVQHFALIGCEHRAEPGRIQNLQALVRRHLAQVAHRGGHGAAAVLRKLLHALKEVAGVLFLLRRKVFPCFHSLEYALPLLGWTRVEMLQALLQLFLLLRWQLLELRIISQGLLLLIQGQVFAVAQPIACMRSWAPGLLHRSHLGILQNRFLGRWLRTRLLSRIFPSCLPCFAPCFVPFNAPFLPSLRARWTPCLGTGRDGQRENRRYEYGSQASLRKGMHCSHGSPQSWIRFS